ncbi:MAG TPA: hypothetical protein VEA99_01910 [Gemmatimonadaceae bacterium]|nr:hypothetical protein [Gemmatimonadaceae bacterium]
MSSTQPKPGDKSAAFTGLIVGAIALLAILYGMVQWTNSRFEGHGASTGAATTTQH